MGTKHLCTKRNFLLTKHNEHGDQKKFITIKKMEDEDSLVSRTWGPKPLYQNKFITMYQNKMKKFINKSLVRKNKIYLPYLFSTRTVATTIPMPI